MRSTTSSKLRSQLHHLVWLILGLSLIVNLSYGNHAVEIQSAILRNRIIVTDHTFMKKALYVAFSVPALNPRESHTILGRLYHERQEIADMTLSSFREKNGNLVFDLPYDIPDGSYTIAIEVKKQDGALIGSRSLTIPRSDLSNYFTPKKKTNPVVLEEQPYRREQREVKATDHDKARGYVLFSRSRFAYVYPESLPKEDEAIDHLTTEAVRNSTATLTLSVHALRSMGNVKVALSELKNDFGTIGKDRIHIASVKSVQGTAGLSKGKYQNLPILLQPGDEAEISAGQSRCFWFTIRIDADTLPGVYEGTITLHPQQGTPSSVPVRISVAPITLEDIPQVDYCMLMTYEFSELAMPWSKEDQDKLSKAALNIFRDYRDHGMTTLCLHSPFVLLTNEDGSPRLDDIYAALRAARDAGFTRPLVWYMGHLIQTAKRKHPGSIAGFEESVEIPRLRSLVRSVTEYAKKNGCPEVVFLPIDEPDDLWQDANGYRNKITKKLLKTVREAGARSMVTVGTLSSAKQADYIASSTFKQDDMQAVHAKKSRYWLYDNNVTLDCTHPAYARYKYGYYTWEHGIDGMSSWTFQNTQNAGGPPAIASASGYNVFLAYPAPEGPISTIKWEAIRDGIDDHKLIFQLEKRIALLKKRGRDTSVYDRFLARMKEKTAEPPCISKSDEDRELQQFEQKRHAVITLILEADRERE
jgi:hypothetical protein